MCVMTLSRIGVDYVHSPDKSAIESHARTILDGASEIAEQRNMKDTYRYIIWPFALLLGDSSRGRAPTWRCALNS